MNISVCCPSYKRPVVKTLKYLPFCKIFVDGSEEQDYKAQNPSANIISCPDGIQGNVARVRNYILDTEFCSGADAVCIVDDDIKQLERFVVDKTSGYGYERVKIETDEFFDYLEKYTQLCDEFGYKLWGVNLNLDNLSYRHCVPFSTVSVILGPFSVHLKNPIRYDESLPLKEDYDICIQHLNKYRGILRVNSIHYDCLQSENKGGCASMRNRQREKEQFELLQKKWGSKIVREDKTSKGHTKKKKQFDYNPIVKVPIRGV